MPTGTYADKLRLTRIQQAPMINSLRYLYNELKQVLLNDNSGRNPREVIDTYLNGLNPGSLMYNYSHIVEEDVQLTMSGNLKPTTPKQMAVLYIRQYCWQYLKSDKALKKKYQTTVFGSSFD